MNTPHRKLPLRIKFPYLARIVCQIGDTVIELARYKRRIDPHAWRGWTDDREDRCWIEQPLCDSQTITSRPGAVRCERAKAIRMLPREGGRL